MYWRSSVNSKTMKDDFEGIDKIAWENRNAPDDKKIEIGRYLGDKPIADDDIAEQQDALREIWKIYQCKVERIAHEMGKKNYALQDKCCRDMSDRDKLIDKISHDLNELRSLTLQYTPIIHDVSRTQDLVTASKKKPLLYQQFEYVFKHHIFIFYQGKSVMMDSRRSYEEVGLETMIKSCNAPEGNVLKIAHLGRWNTMSKRQKYLRIARHIFKRHKSNGYYEGLLNDAQQHQYWKTHYER